MVYLVHGWVLPWPDPENLVSRIKPRCSNKLTSEKWAVMLVLAAGCCIKFCSDVNFRLQKVGKLFHIHIGIQLWEVATGWQLDDEEK